MFKNNKYYNKLYAPFTTKKVLKDYKGIRHQNPDRDKDYSPLFDSIMRTIRCNIEEKIPNSFDDVWTSSLFPEATSTEILRLVEEEIYRMEKERDKKQMLKIYGLFSVILIINIIILINILN